MANTRQVLTDRFVAFSGIGKKQTGFGTPLANSDLDTRDKCTITREEVPDRRVYMDCRGEDPVDTKIQSRFARYTFDYAEVTPQIIARWTAYKEGASAAPTGTPANEVQTLTRNGTVSGGTFTLALTLEGRTVTTKPIAWDATSTAIAAALTAARMKFIEPGDVTITGGTLQVETATAVGNISSAGDLAVTVTAAGMPNSPKQVGVAVLDTDDDGTAIAAKIRAALALDADVSAFFDISGATDQIILTAKAAAANDATMNIALENGTAAGLTEDLTSADTTAGVAGTGWGATGMTLTFANRLGKTNLPLLTVDNTLITGGGTIDAAQVTPGDQNYHAMTRSTSRVKPYVTFAMGWDTVTDRVEKYADYAVDSVTPSGTLDGDVSLQVVMVGPWPEDSLEAAFDIPECVNIDPLQTKDCRIQIDGNWETTDINSINLGSNDNVPTDRLSAFGFDGMDIERLERGRQPTNTFSAAIFGSETDPIYQLALNERTEDPVAVNVHFGMPGNRCSWHFPKVQVYFQTNRLGSAGEAQYSVINIEGLPLKNANNPPFNSTAYLDQATAFLT